MKSRKYRIEKMKTHLALVFAASLALVSVSCSTASVRVMPGVNGAHRAVARDIHQEGAEEAAVKGANEYCEKRGKEARFVQDRPRYTGKMDGDPRNSLEKGSKPPMLLAGNGTPTGTASAAGHMMTSDRDY